MTLLRSMLIALCLVLTAGVLLHGVGWVRTWHALQLHNEIAASHVSR